MVSVVNSRPPNQNINPGPPQSKSLRLSSAIYDLKNPNIDFNFWTLNTDEETPDLCLYYKQLNSLVFV
jgi:hypothetical protein